MFVFHKTHAIRHLESSQSLVLYECLRKRKKDRVPFLRRSQEQRKGRKLLTLKWQQNLLRATKVRSTTKTNGTLEEIASHEPDTSEQGIICWPGLGSGFFSMRQFLWFPTAAKICLFLVTCQTIIVQENGYLL